jgi:hypothetical protein
VVVERHRDLDESLQKLALRFGRGAPDIFEDFVGLEEFGGVEKLDAVM